MEILWFIKGGIFALLLVFASISDIRTRQVKDRYSVMIAFAALIGVSFSDIPGMVAGALLVPLPLFVAALLKPGKMGGADIKIMAACAFLLGFIKGITAMIFGLAIAVICTLIIRRFAKKNIKESLPLVAYLSAGCFLVYVIM